jgi:general transcriptional corepressor CYC8
MTGSFSEILGNLDDALFAYEYALRANPKSMGAMNAISLILRTKEEFPRAVEYLQAILQQDPANGEVWGSLGTYHREAASKLELTSHVCQATAIS